MDEAFELVRRYPTAFVAILGAIVLIAFFWGYDVAYRNAYLEAYAEKARFEVMRGRNPVNG